MLKPQRHFELNLSQAFDVYKKVTFIITSGEIELGFITMHGPINRHQFNRHIADFEKNGLCYLISFRKN